MAATKELGFPKEAYTAASPGVAYFGRATAINTGGDNPIDVVIMCRSDVDLKIITGRLTDRQSVAKFDNSKVVNGALLAAGNLKLADEGL